MATTYHWSDLTWPPSPRRGLRGLLRRQWPGISITVMVVLLIAIVLYPFVLITVPSGDAGVLWKRFSGPGIYCWCILPRGTVLAPTEIRNEGLHFIWPWDKLYIYDLRLQASTQKFNAISKDGVSVDAEITIRYQLAHDSIGVLHEFIGPGYLQSVLIPEVGSVTRSVISKYSAEEVYSTKREYIQNTIENEVTKALAAHADALFQPSASQQNDKLKYASFLQNSIQVLDTLVLSIELPPEIVAAINEKTEQYYKIQEYKYRAEREIEESKRKQIEANGIAAFQQTVTKGISDSYLRWQGIQATLALAQSKNAKIVIIGNSKDGLPLILGNADNPPSPSAEQIPGEAPSPKGPPTGDKAAPRGSAPGTGQSPNSSTLESILKRFSGASGEEKMDGDTAARSK